MDLARRCEHATGRNMTCLESSPSMDDGLDEDAQVLARLSGLVALQTEAESG